jgi:leader peptidase (prepilin peptidase) / N-methyltransferase
MTLAPVIACLAGLAVGSFLNVVVTRLPRGESVASGRSRCPACGVPLAWRDNIPLFSYVLLGGRCRTCRAPIPWRYPVVELLSGALALALWHKFLASPLLLAYGPFAAALVALTFLDLEHFWIPDRITYPGIALGLALALFLPHLPFTDALLGAVLGGAALFAVAWSYQRLTGREGLGGGDVKLMAMIGAVLGVWALPWVLFFSALLGSVAGLWAAWKSGEGGRTPIPYGPFLGAAALIYLFWQEKLGSWGL